MGRPVSGQNAALPNVMEKHVDPTAVVVTAGHAMAAIPVKTAHAHPVSPTVKENPAATMAAEGNVETAPKANIAPVETVSQANAKTPADKAPSPRKAEVSAFATARAFSTTIVAKAYASPAPKKAPAAPPNATGKNVETMGATGFAAIAPWAIHATISVVSPANLNAMEKNVEAMSVAASAASAATASNAKTSFVPPVNQSVKTVNAATMDAGEVVANATTNPFVREAPALHANPNATAKNVETTGAAEPVETVSEPNNVLAESVSASQTHARALASRGAATAT